MNKKPKSKNRQNKPQNPISPQDVDIKNDPEKVTIEEITEIETKTEERVPEIVSEVVIVEGEEGEFESPKKPKRNRVKKKKDQPQDVTEEIKEESKSKEDSTKQKVEEKSENTLIIEIEKVTSQPVVEPQGRKKKGKKTTENIGKKDEIVAKSPEPPKVVDIPMATEATSETVEQDGKGKKKNKKGKKRTDSERSDKCEEALLCTAAFQKILQPRNDTEPKKDVKNTETDASVSVPSKMQEKIKDDSLDINKDNNKDAKIDEKSKKGQKKPDATKKEAEILKQSSEECLPKSDSQEISEIKSEKITSKPSQESNIESTAVVVENKDVLIEKPPEKPKKDKKKGKQGEKIEIDKVQVQIQPTIEKDETVPTKTPDVIAPIAETAETIPSQEIKIHNVPKEDPTKNKNKKDKKQSPKDNLHEQNQGEQKTIEKPSEPVKLADILSMTEVKPVDTIQDQTKGPKEMVKESNQPKEDPSKPHVPELSSHIKCVNIESILTETPTSENKEEKCTGARPKAKIVKPVEKNKEKGKHDVLGTPKEEILEIKETVALDTQNIVEISKDKTEKNIQMEYTEQKKEDKPLEIKSETQIKDDIKTTPVTVSIDKEPQPVQTKQITQQSLSDILLGIIEKPMQSKEIENPVQTKETLDTQTSPAKLEEPHAKEDGKKHKKSPKPQRKGKNIQEAAKQVDDDSEQMKTASTSLETAMPIPEMSNVAIGPEIIPRDDPIPKSVTDILLGLIESPTSIKEESELTAEVSSTKAKLEEPIEKDQGKKNRKSPKPQRKAKYTQIEDKPVSLEKIPADVVDIKPRDHFADIDEELNTIETKIITPDDVEPPRCASAHRIDNNNNVVIQEIHTSNPPVVSNLPEVIPSNITPINTVTANVPTTVEDKVVPQDTNKNQPKSGTDLKSKVMEVNKDMEELRLSIERSIAEFSALEKSDQDSFQREGSAETKSKTKTSKVKDDTKVPQESTTEIKPVNISEISAPIPMTNIPIPLPDVERKITTPLPVLEEKQQEIETNLEEAQTIPIPPQRKENKGKNKSKKNKGKQETSTQTSTQQTSANVSTTSTTTQQDNTQKDDRNSKKDSKSEGDTKNQEKKQTDSTEKQNTESNQALDDIDIVNFEDALTTSIDDVTNAFEVIAEEVNQQNIAEEIQKNQDNDSESDEKKKIEEERKAKENPVSQPKNYLGHPHNPVPSNKTDYKKEKNKTPNTITAKVKIKDSEEIERKNKPSQSQTIGRFRNGKNANESISVTNENEEYIYKYSFRNVFLTNACQLCKIDLRKTRVGCNFCYLIFYCSQKHKDDDYAQHQSLCFAVSTLCHLKGQKHIYADTKNLTGYNYRLVRMQAIISCEKILKRKLEPWEQEALLYPRMCAEPGCREWMEDELTDCPDCGQIAYCKSNPAHLPKIHHRYCGSYLLYQKLVVHQRTQGRLEPKLPTRVLSYDKITDNINRLLADMYDEKIDMTDIEYASLTQLATAPLTSVYSYQLYKNKMMQVYHDENLFKKSTFTIHVIGAELQFEADSLHKWETFFLHVKPDVQELKIVLIGQDLNPGNLPLDLLGKVKLCPNCRVERRRLEFIFEDNQYYHQYFTSPDFIKPDIVCAFNPSIQRTSKYTENDTWILTLNSIIKLKIPFLVTSYSMTELQRDLNSIKMFVKNCVNLVSEPKFNPFASVRPDRNFISDDEMPLLFKNYCYMVLIGAF